jgi:hypothetical protein
MENTYFGIDGFLAKLNNGSGIDGKVRAGLLKITTPGIIRRQFDSLSDKVHKIYGHVPILMESDEIGTIKLSRGIKYKDGENHRYFNRLVINIDEIIELDCGKIPKCVLEFYKEYDSQSGVIRAQTINYSTNRGKNIYSALKEILPVTLFMTADQDSYMTKFWQAPI